MPANSYAPSKNARNAFYSAALGAPAASNSGAFLQMGLGATIKVTPSATGRVKILVTGWMKNGTAAGESDAQLCYGTGAAPANGAAATGTVEGAATSLVAASAGQVVPFALYAEITGLVLGTQIWVDLQVRGIAGSATVNNLAVVVEEF